MEIAPIRTKSDHKAALARIEMLWDAEPGTPDHDTLDVLATLVDAWERAHLPILPPDPIEAIKHRLEQEGLTRKALEPLVGTRARVSEILSGRRSLTLPMIRALNERLRIPLDVLVAERNKSSTAKKASRARTAGRRASR